MSDQLANLAEAKDLAYQAVGHLNEAINEINHVPWSRAVDKLINCQHDARDAIRNAIRVLDKIESPDGEMKYGRL